MFQISKLDLTNVDILEEQLIGVDVAYFDKLITILRIKIICYVVLIVLLALFA